MSDFIANFSDPRLWDSFVAKNAGSDGGLLQSFAWGEVQRRYGRRVWRVAATDGGNVAAGWQVVEQLLPLGQRYWYAPRPIENFEFRISNFEFFISRLSALAKKERVTFLRVDAWENSKLADFGFKKISGSGNPLEELHVDVMPDADAILSAMKQKTRYNIRLAQKHGVTVSELPLDDRGFAIFSPLVREMATRQKIRIHPEAYYRAMFSELAAAGVGHLFVASWQGTPLATALLVSYNQVLTYLHGGSADVQGEVMAPHLLHWQAILFAKTLGCKKYNFGGVSEANPAWAGMTRFKHGFAPTAAFTRFGGLYDLPLRPVPYRLYQLAKTLPWLR